MGRLCFYHWNVLLLMAGGGVVGIHIGWSGQVVEERWNILSNSYYHYLIENINLLFMCWNEFYKCKWQKVFESKLIIKIRKHNKKKKGRENCKRILINILQQIKQYQKKERCMKLEYQLKYYINEQVCTKNN